MGDGEPIILNNPRGRFLQYAGRLGLTLLLSGCKVPFNLSTDENPEPNPRLYETPTNLPYSVDMYGSGPVGSVHANQVYLEGHDIWSNDTIHVLDNPIEIAETNNGHSITFTPEAIRALNERGGFITIVLDPRGTKTIYKVNNGNNGQGFSISMTGLSTETRVIEGQQRRVYVLNRFSQNDAITSSQSIQTTDVPIALLIQINPGGINDDTTFSIDVSKPVK